jgi:hypothetical protein
MEICEPVREEFASSAKFSFGPQAHISATEIGGYVRINIGVWVGLQNEDSLVWGVGISQRDDDWLLDSSVERLPYGEAPTIMQSAAEVVSSFRVAESRTLALLTQLSEDVRPILRSESGQ